jgi:hypothetical protein
MGPRQGAVSESDAGTSEADSLPVGGDLVHRAFPIKPPTFLLDRVVAAPFKCFTNYTAHHNVAYRAAKNAKRQKCCGLGASVSVLSARHTNALNHIGNYTHHLLQQQTTLHSAHTVYLCVPYGSHNKQRLFPQTALTGWAL